MQREATSGAPLLSPTMPAVLSIRVNAGRGLPVMDRATNLTDAYVVVRVGAGRKGGDAEASTFRTKVSRKTLDPVWDEEFTVRVVDDRDLEETPIEFLVWDKDDFSADDLIGSVYTDVTGLLARLSDGSDRQPTLEGWFPLFDTLEGVRGELHVRVQVIKYVESSPVVRFFSSSRLPQSLYSRQAICGFVQELIVEEDPEYAFADNFRAARQSNQKRMQLLHWLSMSLRRQIAKQVAAAGGNAFSSTSTLKVTLASLRARSVPPYCCSQLQSAAVVCRDCFRHHPVQGVHRPESGVVKR